MTDLGSLLSIFESAFPCSIATHYGPGKAIFPKSPRFHGSSQYLIETSRVVLASCSFSVEEAVLRLAPNFPKKRRGTRPPGSSCRSGRSKGSWTNSTSSCKLSSAIDNRLNHCKSTHPAPPPSSPQSHNPSPSPAHRSQTTNATTSPTYAQILDC